MSIPTVVFLCAFEDITRVRRGGYGYFHAFSKKVNTICISQEKWHNSRDLSQILPDNVEPILILNIDSWPRRLPDGLTDIPFPTAIFNVDTFETPKERAQFSKLFDYSFVFHPGFDSLFKDLGHPASYFLPHAVEEELFEQDHDLARIYDIGWVGRLEGKNYSFRRRIISGLSQKFRMNDISKFYPPEEMSNIYKQSKLVINVSRDDHLQDANLRCFEVMASGALLVTPNPTELSGIGFTEGLHYITFNDETDLNKKVQYYLEHEQERKVIAKNARELVLRDHTYGVRVQTILDLIHRNQGKLFAPARAWSPVMIHRQYLNHFCGAFMFNDMFRELNKIYKNSPLVAYSCSLFLLRAFAIKLRDSLR